jgi:exopolysaccharide production protein ExoY
LRVPSSLCVRLADIAFATIALIVLSPIAVIIIAILSFQNGPIIYCHKRIGQFKKTFHCYKFRSMITDADRVLTEHLSHSLELQFEWKCYQKLKHDPRITPFGRWLRTTSLDEIPQFINVLIGDMSIVGHRPITESELSRYQHYGNELLRHKPGITGLSQVSGRSLLTYRRRKAHDIFYLRHFSCSLYFYILFKTFWVVITRKGAG